MNFEVEYSEDDGFVRITVYAALTRELHMEIAGVAIPAAKKAGVTNYLVDNSRVRYIAPPFEQFQTAYDGMEEFELEKGSRTALIVSPGDISHDFTLLLYNRAGFECEKFTDEKEAIDWLMR